MSQQFTNFSNNPSLMTNSIFYSPTIEFIKCLQRYSQQPLLTSSSRKTFRSRTRTAMFTLLSSTWSNLDTSRYTRSLIPLWKPMKFPSRISSRKAETCYLRFAFSQNDSRVARHAIIPSIDPICAFCRQCNETIEHIFFQCPAHNSARSDLLANAKPAPTLAQLLIDPVYAKRTQSFLNKIKFA